MHYVTIPDPITLVDDLTDAPLPELFSFSDYVRVLRKDQRFLTGVDQMEAYDATASLIKAKPGDVVPLQDETQKVLAACAKRPTTVGPAVIYSPGGEIFVKALTEAPTRP
jgi:hypothetical protein